jgi:HSP20 family protein
MLTGPFRMDLHEDAKNNTVTATFELPGLNKDNVQIGVQNGRLSISGETELSSEHEASGYAVRERKHGKFTRTLQLPRDITVSNAESV